MVVLILEKVPRRLKGELTRWLLEVDTGVFVGRVGATVRDLLWAKAVDEAGGGRCALAYPTNNEQGFALRLHGYADRRLRDYEGLVLLTIQNAEVERRRKKLERLS